MYEGIARIEVDLKSSISMGIQDLVAEKMGPSDESSSRLQTQSKVIERDTVIGKVMDRFGLPGTNGL